MSAKVAVAKHLYLVAVDDGDRCRRPWVTGCSLSRCAGNGVDFYIHQLFDWKGVQIGGAAPSEVPSQRGTRAQAATGVRHQQDENSPPFRKANREVDAYSASSWLNACYSGKELAFQLLDDLLCQFQKVGADPDPRALRCREVISKPTLFPHQYHIDHHTGAVRTPAGPRRVRTGQFRRFLRISGNDLFPTG